LYLPPISPGKTGFSSFVSGALLSAILASLPPDFLLVITVFELNDKSHFDTKSKHCQLFFYGRVKVLIWR